MLSRKESEEIELENYGADETLWQPTGSSETKRHNTIILKFSEPSPVLNAETQTCDASTFFVFSKIKKEFAALRERLDGGENSAIAEANEEEEEDEDNDDDDDGEGDGAEGEGLHLFCFVLNSEKVLQIDSCVLHYLKKMKSAGANGGDDASIFSQSTNASLGQQSTGTKRTEASSSSKPASASAGIAAIGEEMEEGKTDSAAEAPSVAAAAGADISDTRDESIERSGTDSRRTSPVPSSRKHAQSPTPSAHKGSHSPLGSSSASFRNAGAASPARSGSGSGSRGRTARGDSQRQVSAQELPAAAATVATEAEELGQSAAGPAEDAASSKGEKDKQAGNGEDDEDFLAYSNNFDDEQD